MLVMRRFNGAPARAVAPVRFTISAKVKPAGRSKNSSSAIPPVPSTGPDQWSEFRAAAKHELLNYVVVLFRERERIVDAKRSKRRIPHQTHANRRSWHFGIGGADVGPGARNAAILRVA